MTWTRRAGRHAGDALDPAARRSPVWWVVALVVAALALGSGAVVGLDRAPRASASSSTPWLPFDKGTLSTTSKLVFAHYLPSLPISLDNKAPASDYWQVNYVNPDGEGGSHRAYGGFTRDRPLGRDPLGASWRLLDMETEVRQAMSAGIDGFAVDLLTTSTSAQTYQNVVLLLQAAHAVSPTFKIMLQPDTSSLSGASASAMAALTHALGAYPAAYRDPQGRLLVSPFFAELHSASWWQGYESIMATTYNDPVALFPVLLDDLNNRDAFAPISVGIGQWGARDASWNPPDATYPTGPTGRIAAVHSLGKMWMQPVGVQDSRPSQGNFQEAQNTLALRNTWQIARSGGADWVLLPTWNDYTENSDIAPSVHHGYTFLDLMAYYISWFKTGTRPTIVRDAVYLTHRNESTSARPTYPQTLLMSPMANVTPTNNVEALSFLTAPATVSLSVGGVVTTCSAPAGVSTCTAPLRPGEVKVAVTRADGLVAAVTSPWTVTSSPYVQDFEYVGVSSLRGADGSTGSSAPAGPVQTTTTVAQSSRVVTTENRGVFRVDVAPWYVRGSVALKVDGATVATAPLSGTTALLTAPLLAAGAHTVTAEYVPSSATAYVASVSGSLPVDVIDAATHAPIVVVPAHLSVVPLVGRRVACNAQITNSTSAYQWRVDGRPVAGASGATFLPTVPLLGHRLSCLVSAHGPLGSAVSAAPAIVVRPGAAPKALTRPAYRSSVRAGRVVSVTPGTWSMRRLHATYVWRVNGHIVARTATGWLTMKRSWRYRTLTVEVRVTKTGYRTGSARTVAATIR